METRLKIAMILLMIYGSVFSVLGVLADTLLPLFGFAHNPGFAAGQIGMLTIGVFTIMIALFLHRDWK